MTESDTPEDVLRAAIEELDALVQLWTGHREAGRAFALAKTKAEESLQWLRAARELCDE